jgi:hypothetical protein
MKRTINNERENNIIISDITHMYTKQEMNRFGHHYT